MEHIITYCITCGVNQDTAPDIRQQTDVTAWHGTLEFVGTSVHVGVMGHPIVLPSYQVHYSKPPWKCLYRGHGRNDINGVPIGLQYHHNKLFLSIGS